MWGVLGLLAAGIILTVTLLVGGANDQPVASEAGDVVDRQDPTVGEPDGAAGDGGEVPRREEPPVKGGGTVDDGSRPGSLGDVVYRSDVAAATAKAYEAVVSVVMPSDAETADWDDIYAIGSGIIFRIEGDTALIVTNHHVASASEELEIVLSNGDKRSAEVIGSDAISDLAVLKIEANGITKAATFGSSDDLQIGEKAIAIGNPLGLGFAHTITQGIVSSTQRSIPVSLSGNGSLDWEMEVIQTDAAINSGNSGGALINIEGDVIGINTMKIAWFGVEGLGFAIPIDLARPVIEELITQGRVSRPYIGIGAVNLADYIEDEPLDLPEDVTAGAVIMTVSGPAKSAGLREYDVIVQLDDTRVRDMIDVRKYLYTQKQIGDPIEVTVYRNGRERSYSFDLGELPE